MRDPYLRTCALCGLTRDREEFPRTPDGNVQPRCEDCYEPPRRPLVRTPHGPDGMTWLRLGRILSFYLDMRQLLMTEGIDSWRLYGVEIHTLDLLTGFSWLSDNQRRVVFYSCLCGRNEREIAEIMGMPKSRVHYFRKSGLKKLLMLQGHCPPAKHLPDPLEEAQ